MYGMIAPKRADFNSVCWEDLQKSDNPEEEIVILNLSDHNGSEMGVRLTYDIAVQTIQRLSEYVDVIDRFNQLPFAFGMFTEQGNKAVQLYCDSHPGASVDEVTKAIAPHHPEVYDTVCREMIADYLDSRI